MKGYLKKAEKSLKNFSYFLKHNPGALVTGIVSGMTGATYRIVIGKSVTGHDEIFKGPDGNPAISGGTTGNLFNSWWNPGFNRNNYVSGPAVHPLNSHDTTIYNSCTGFGGFMTGLLFSLAAALAGFGVYKTIKSVYNLFDSKKLKKHHKKRSKLLVGEKKQTLDDVVTA